MNIRTRDNGCTEPSSGLPIDQDMTHDEHEHCQLTFISTDVLETAIWKRRSHTEQ